MTVSFLSPHKIIHPAPRTIQIRATSEETQSEMKTVGTQMILAAAKEAGATEPMIAIDWKADRIVVTIDVHADESYNADFVDDDEFEEEEWEEVVYDADIDGLIDEDELASMNFDDFDQEDFDESSNVVDVTKIARTINEYLSKDGEGSLGDRIAQMHEIEVTTPEFDNVLRGERMFAVYKGFDVIVEHWEEQKKNKSKTIVDKESAPRKLVVTEGKLVGRDTEKSRTTVNVKGRNKNIKNELIESVKLPKAKREKGAK